LDLTEEEKEKLKGSYKVAKKLEKLEGSNKKDVNSDSESDKDEEYTSLESPHSGKTSPMSGRCEARFMYPEVKPLES
jgi:exonuclease 3'-5' domain-containing protein 1